MKIGWLKRYSSYKRYRMSMLVAHLQLSLVRSKNNGSRDISSISLIPGFNRASGKAVKRIIWFLFCKHRSNYCGKNFLHIFLMQ